MPNFFEKANLKQEPSVADKRRILKDAIARATTEARPLEEVEQVYEKDALVLADFLNRKISLADFHERGSRKYGDLLPGDVELSSLDEMFDYFRKVSGEETAQEIVGHEREHLSEIQKIGWESRLLLQLARHPNGSVSARPGVEPKVPTSGDEDDIRNKLRSIIEAPHDLSNLDIMASGKEKA